MLNPAPPTPDSAYTEANALREDRRLRLKDRIDELDAEIDQAVFELYGLTEEEIEVVKGSEKP